MKIFLRILAAGVTVFCILFSVLYVSTGFLGKIILVSQLERLTGRKVTIGYFDVLLPLQLEIRDLNIEGLSSASKIIIAPSIPHLFLGTIALNNISITRPTIILEKAASLKVNESSAAKAIASPPAPVIKPVPARKQPLRLIIKRLTISDGVVDFTDHTVGPEGIKITVGHINFKLSDLYTFSFPAIATFELTGRIPWKQDKAEGKVTLDGWLNFYKKDIQAAFKVVDIDAIYLVPYYSKWIDLEKARIEKAKLSFTSNIHGLNNDVTAECHLELTEIVLKPRPVEEPAEKAEKVRNVVMNALKAQDQGKIALDFTKNTKMDKPEFGLGSNIKDAFENKLAKARSGKGVGTQEVIMFPARLLEGLVRSAADVSKAVIDGSFAVGKELKGAVKGSFEKEPK